MVLEAGRCKVSGEAFSSDGTFYTSSRGRSKRVPLDLYYKGKNPEGSFLMI
jgi:NADH:ubiquinone oxidoreductase subunit B-like Fe-S oxidoreductase